MRVCLYPASSAYSFLLYCVPPKPPLCPSPGVYPIIDDPHLPVPRCLVGRMRKRKVQKMKEQASGQGQVEEVWDLGDSTQAELVTPETLLSGEQPSPTSSLK